MARCFWSTLQRHTGAAFDGNRGIIVGSLGTSWEYVAMEMWIGKAAVAIVLAARLASAGCIGLTPNSRFIFASVELVGEETDGRRTLVVVLKGDICLSIRW